MAISTLQQALAGINSQVAETVEKVIDQGAGHAEVVDTGF